MAKKMKLRLEDLKVESFVTVLSPEESETIKAKEMVNDDYDDAIDQRKKQAKIPKDSIIAVSFLWYVCGCLAF